MNNLIVDNQQIKYQVINSEGHVLTEEFSYADAARFVKGLNLNEGEAVSIVPVIPTGEQILLG